VLTALISDLHGNLAALTSAVADARLRGAEEIICAGDLVGYGPLPDEVCGFMDNNHITAISGNYDCKVLDVLAHGEQVASGMSKKKRKLLSWTAAHLGKGSRTYLRALPASLRHQMPDGRSLLVVHGSPASNDDDILPSITSRGLEAKMGGAKTDILVCAHTHIPFIKRLGGTLVINCGSAGLPVDGDPRPSYALLQADKSAVHARIIRFEYNVSLTLAALKKTILPQGLQRDFAEGSKRRFMQ
jgi:putative phosphoesterase